MGNKFVLDENYILYDYMYEYVDYDEIIRRIKSYGHFSVHNTLFFKNKHITKHDDYECYFIVAEKENGYYKLSNDVFNIKKGFYIHEKIKKLKTKYFYCYQESIIRKVLEIINEDFYLTNENSNGFNYMTIDEYEKLLELFPTTYEKNLYVNKRITEVLSNYFLTNDYVNNYNEFIRKNRKLLKPISKIQNDYENKIIQYNGLLNLFKKIVDDDSILEEDFQKIILDILLILFPKYLLCLEKVDLIDSNNNHRILDYLLIDANGYVDVVEIKKPSVPGPLTAHRTYRNNYYPVSELSGSLTQIEKYLYCLNSNREKNENRINKRIKDLNINLAAKINNPQGYIIYGRSNNMNDDQKNDFEIIKRNYKNIIDIFTYDDLIIRLQNSINFYSMKC